MKKSLITIVLEKSKAESIEDAKLEWEIVSVKFDEDSKCDCGHRPIWEVITLTNYLTGEEINIGNVCVKEFTGYDLREVIKDLQESFDISKRPVSGVLNILVANGVLLQQEVYTIEAVYSRPKKFRKQSILDNIYKKMIFRLRFRKLKNFSLSCLNLKPKGATS